MILVHCGYFDIYFWTCFAEGFLWRMLWGFFVESSCNWSLSDDGMSSYLAVGETNGFIDGLLEGATDGFFDKTVVGLLKEATDGIFDFYLRGISIGRLDGNTVGYIQCCGKGCDWITR